MSVNRYFESDEIDPFKQFEANRHEDRHSTRDRSRCSESRDFERYETQSDLRDYLKSRNDRKRTFDSANEPNDMIAGTSSDYKQRFISDFSPPRENLRRSRSCSRSPERGWSTIDKSRQFSPTFDVFRKSRSPELLRLQKPTFNQYGGAMKRSPPTHRTDPREQSNRENDEFSIKSRCSITPGRYSSRSTTPVNPYSLSNSSNDTFSISKSEMMSAEPSTFHVIPNKEKAAENTFKKQLNSSYTYDNDKVPDYNLLSVGQSTQSNVNNQRYNSSNHLIPVINDPYANNQRMNASVTDQQTVFRLSENRTDFGAIVPMQQNQQFVQLATEIPDKKELLFREYQEIRKLRTQFWFKFYNELRVLNRSSTLLKLLADPLNLQGRFFMNKYSKSTESSNNILIEGNCYQSPIKKNIPIRLPFTGMAFETQEVYNNRMYFCNTKKILRILNIDEKKSMTVQKAPSQIITETIVDDVQATETVVPPLASSTSSVAYCQRCRRDLSKKMYFDAGTQTDFVIERVHSPSNLIMPPDIKPKGILKNFGTKRELSPTQKQPQPPAKQVLNVEEYWSRHLNREKNGTPSMPIKMSSRGAFSNSYSKRNEKSEN